MKTIIMLLISISCYSQVSLYIPYETHHFDRDFIWQYADNQGGDKGLVVSYEISNLITTIGCIRNSYGGSSNLFLIGFKRDYNKFDVSLSIGGADGYKRFYKYYPNKPFPKFFKDNYIVPVALFTTRIKVYNNIGIQVNISPAYINYGFFIKI